MPPKPRNLTHLTLATLMLAGSLTTAPLLAKPATTAPARADVDSTGWMKPDPAMDKFIADLMAKMTLEEKIGQLSLLTSDWDSTGPTMRQGYQEDIRKGRIGSIFNAFTAKYTRDLQRVADTHASRGLGALSVDFDLAGFDRLLGDRPSLEEARGPQPQIETDAFRSSCIVHRVNYPPARFFAGELRVTDAIATVFKRARSIDTAQKQTAARLKGRPL